MNLRGFIFGVYLSSFIIGVIYEAINWQLINNVLASTPMGFLIFVLLHLVSVCTVLLAFCVYAYGEEIEKLRELTGLVEFEQEELRSGITLEELMERKGKTKAENKDT